MVPLGPGGGHGVEGGGGGGRDLAPGHHQDHLR